MTPRSWQASRFSNLDNVCLDSDKTVAALDRPDYHSSIMYEYMRISFLKKWAVGPTVTPPRGESGEGQPFRGDLSGPNSVKRLLRTRSLPMAQNRS